MTRVALKIDVDTYRGTRDGVPAMLADLRAAGVRASFFFSVGPDRSGRAVFKLLADPRFLAKMVRTNAGKMYGWRTALYGTLLPAPLIGRRCAEILRHCRDEGHEVGLHAWDHRTWQDRLGKLPRSRVEEEIDRGIAAFSAVFGAPPRAFAAPAWASTDDALEALAARDFDYVSVSRGRVPPFYPLVRGRVLPVMELPTTLPTLDEDLGREGTTPGNYVERLLRRYRPGAQEVLTVHAETEGIAYRGLFQDLLARHRALEMEIGPLLRLFDEAARDPSSVPVRAVNLGEVPGRAGRVAVPAEAAASR